MPTRWPSHHRKVLSSFMNHAYLLMEFPLYQSPTKGTCMGSRLAGVAATFLLAAGVMQFVAHAQLSLPAHAQEIPIAQRQGTPEPRVLSEAAPGAFVHAGALELKSRQYEGSGDHVAFVLGND